MGQAAGKPFGAGAAAVINRPLQCQTGWEREERQEIGGSRLDVLACFLHHDRSGCLSSHNADPVLCSYVRTQPRSPPGASGASSSASSASRGSFPRGAFRSYSVCVMATN